MKIDIIFDCASYVSDFVKLHRKELLMSAVIIATSILVAILIAINEDALIQSSDFFVDKAIDALVDRDINILGYFFRQIFGFFMILVILVLLSIVFWESFLTYCILFINSLALCMNIIFMATTLGLVAIPFILLSIVFYVGVNILLSFSCVLCINRAYCFTNFGYNGEGTFAHLLKKLVLVFVIYVVLCILYCILIAILVLPFCG